jgi:hypothetical protein
MPGRARRSSNGNGGGGGKPPPVDPIIAGLLARLPKSGEVWPIAGRKLWLQLLEGSFQLIHKDAATAARGTEGLPPAPTGLPKQGKRPPTGAASICWGIYVGVRRPGEFSHLAATSIWPAFRRSSSRRMPWGMPSACLRKLIASSSKRYWNIDDLLKRRRCNMAVLPVRLGGSATGVLITDKCHGPGGDSLNMEAWSQ